MTRSFAAQSSNVDQSFNVIGDQSANWDKTVIHFAHLVVVHQCTGPRRVVIFEQHFAYRRHDSRRTL